jgi:hypothetical protein
VALGAEEAERHRAADQQRVGDVEEAVDQRDLVGDLRASEYDDQRPCRILEQPLEHGHLALKQQPGDGGSHPFGGPHRRRVRAVRRAEGVADEGVAERRERGRQLRVVPGLPRLPACVFEHQDAPGVE